MTRRSRGEGTVFYDKGRGRWVGQIDLGTDPATGRRQRRKVSAATKTGCLEALADLRAEKRRAGIVGPQDVTVAKIVADLLASPPPRWKSQITADVNRRHAERITAGLGKVKLARLTPAGVDRFLASLAAGEHPLSARTISATRGVLREAIRRAERDGLIGRNVADLADMPAAGKRESRALTLEQIAALLAADLTPWWRAYLVTGITMGLRPGELLGLRWADVDFGAGVIRVRVSLKMRCGEDGKLVRYLDDLKTERSRRTLAMTRPASATLKALRTAQAADRLRLGRAYAGPGTVFCAPDGGLPWPQVVRARFARLLRSAGIPGTWHPHEMRHTFVSVLSAAGVDIEDIADAAGHINSNVTRTVYRHQIADRITRAPAAMDAIFGQVSGS